MKKHLLITSALVAAGLVGMSGAAVAQKAMEKKSMGPSLTVHAYANAYFGYADNDKNNTGASPSGKGAGVAWNDFNVKLDSEVSFNGRVMTDNGLTIQAVLELEGPDPAPVRSQQWDEAYVRVNGAFGESRIGSEDAAVQLMTTGYFGIWATAVGTQYDVEVGDWITRPAGFAFDPTPATPSGDEARITYITPRIQGFQLGASYAPTDQGGPASGGVLYPDEFAKPIARDNDNENDLISVAANFDQKFGDTRFGIAAGWETWRARKGSAPRNKRMNYYTVGASVENGPFKVAAGYRYGEGNSLSSAGGPANGSGEGWTVQAGGRYTMGANAFSAGFHYSKLDGCTTAFIGAGPTSTCTAALTSGQDKETGVLVSYARTLAPGTKLSLNGIYADYNNDADGLDFDGFALVGVLGIRF